MTRTEITPGQGTILFLNEAAYDGQPTEKWAKALHRGAWTTFYNPKALDPDTVITNPRKERYALALYDVAVALCSISEDEALAIALRFGIAQGRILSYMDVAYEAGCSETVARHRVDRAILKTHAPLWEGGVLRPPFQVLVTGDLNPGFLHGVSAGHFWDI